MIVGVMADSHDNIPMIAKAVRLFRHQQVESIIHAGDFVAPFAVRELMKAGLPVTGIFGNNDGEKEGIGRICRTIYEPPHRFELGGRTVALVHDRENLRPEDATGADVIIYAHDHKAGVEPGPPLLLNPGECGGWLSGRATVALLDLRELDAHIVGLDT